MAVRGKSINLYLMDGDANGRIKCTLTNWTGVAYKIPRTALDLCRERSDLKQSGVYFLFGMSDNDGTGEVYIGPAGARKNGEGILNRLQEHRRNPEKSYWTEAVVLTTSNNTLGPTEISYLENRFCILAAEANRYTVRNGNEPNMGTITEEKESEMEEFIDRALVIIGALGYKCFEPLIAPAAGGSGRASVMFCINGRGARAKGMLTEEGFVVLAGSMIRPDVTHSCPDYVKTSREKYSGIIADNVLQKDILFNSPSAASSFVVGGSSNGTTEWKTGEGKTLKAVEEEARGPAE